MLVPLLLQSRLSLIGFRLSASGFRLPASREPESVIS